MSSRSWALAIALILIAGSLGYFLLGGKSKPLAGGSSGTATETPTGVILNNMATSVASTTSKGQTVVVNMTAKNFSFAPDTVRINEGDTVEFRIASTGSHNFSIDALGVSEALPSGQTTVIRFAPEAKGTYEFYCNVPGHKSQGMKGQLIVH